MKKFLRLLLKTVVIVLSVIVVGGLTYVWFALNYFNPLDPETNVDKTRLVYFQDSYQGCRAAFKAQALEVSKRLDSVHLFKSKVYSKYDNDLTIDYCYIPAKTPGGSLFILSSGTHGVEGYVGSAVQQMLMKEILEPSMQQKTGFLLIHGLNPYGFKFTRRVTENNVDFNRNCDINASIFTLKNAGYSKLYEMLNPQGKSDPRSLKNQFFMLSAVEKLMKESMQSLRQAVLQGQYEYPDGLYFGGKAFEPQLDTIGKIIKNKSIPYKVVFNIDLHTGYGERGVLHLFPNPAKNPDVKSGLEKIFEGYKIDWGDSKDFYTVTGQFSEYIGELMPEKLFMPMVFEYGSLNSQTTVGSIKSLHNMILENQGFHNGYKTTADSLEVKKTIMEMYNPSSEKWRSKIMNDSKTMLEKVIARVGEF